MLDLDLQKTPVSRTVGMPDLAVPERNSIRLDLVLLAEMELDNICSQRREKKIMRNQPTPTQNYRPVLSFQGL